MGSRKLFRTDTKNNDAKTLYSRDESDILVETLGPVKIIKDERKESDYETDIRAYEGDFIHVYMK